MRKQIGEKHKCQAQALVFDGWYQNLFWYSGHKTVPPQMTVNYWKNVVRVVIPKVVLS